MEQPLSKPSVCFEVEKILGISSDGSYQVQWAPAWVSRFHLVGCEHLIQEFLQQQSHLTQDLDCEKEGRQYNRQSNTHQPTDVDGSCGKGQPEMPLVPLGYTTQLQQQHSMLQTCDESNLKELETVNNCTINELTDTQFYPETVYQDDSKTALPAAVNHGNSFISIIGTDDTILNENALCTMQHTKGTLETVEVKVEDEEEENTTEFINSVEGSSNSLGLHHNSDDHSVNSVNNELPHTHSIHEEGVNFSYGIDSNNDSTNNNDSHSLKKHVCTICQRRFRSKGHLRDHVATHTGVRPYACAYRHCNGSFIQKSNLKEHIRRVHREGEIPLQRAAPHRETVVKNTNKVNSNVSKKHVCSFCNRRFRNTGHLRDHLLLHTGVRPFACEHCRKTFTQKCNLNKHLLTHTGEKPYTCLQCGKKFIQKRSMNYHLQKCPDPPPTDT